MTESEEDGAVDRNSCPKAKDLQCCGLGSEFDSFKRCSAVVGKSHFCVECKAYCCVQCIIADDMGEVYLEEMYGRRVLCSQHTRGALTSHLPPLRDDGKETLWEQLSRMDKWKEVPKEALRNARNGSKVPCFWNHVERDVGLDEDPFSSQWWVQAILRKESDEKWGLYDERCEKEYKIVNWGGNDGLCNLWDRNFRPVGVGGHTTTTVKMEESESPAKKKSKPILSKQQSNKGWEKHYEEAAMNASFFEPYDSDGCYDSGVDSMQSNKAVRERGQRRSKNNSYLRDSRLHSNHHATAKVTAFAGKGEEKDDDDSSACSSMSGSKRLTPDEFMNSLGEVMSETLLKNKVKNKPDTYNTAQLREFLEKIVRLKSVLLAKATKLEGEIDGHSFHEIIGSKIPKKGPLKKESKESIVKKLVTAWSVTQYIVGNGDDQISLTGRDLTSYNAFRDVMSAIEVQCHNEMFNQNVDKKYRSLPVPPNEVGRGYLEGDRAKKSTHPCASCQCSDVLVDEPPSNWDKRSNNKKKKSKWNRESKIFSAFKSGKGDRRLLDEEGNTVTKLKPPTYEKELYVCHCGQNDDTDCQCLFVCPKLEYDEYYQYYYNRKKSNAKERAQQLERSTRVLEDAARTREMSYESHLSHLITQQERGQISSSIPVEKLKTQAMTVAFQNQAIDITNRNFPPEAFEELDNAVDELQQAHNGPTMTTTHGDMKVYGGVNTPAAQRARNNGLTVTASVKQGQSLPTGQRRRTGSHQPSYPPTPRQLCQQQQPTPDYIAGPRNEAEDMVAFGDKSKEEKVTLYQVSTALDNRDKKMVKMAWRWKQGGMADKKIVEGLSEIKDAANKGRRSS